MATSTFLSNATISITQGATTTDMSDQGNACTITVGYDSLESTAFGDTGHRFTQGLQTVDVSIDFFLSYGATEVEAILASCLGTGSTVLTISPSGATESATNPEYVITNAMLASFTPINSTVGSLATVTAQFTGGTWVRDITAP
ncbi:hypothetical protein UFOVP564_15 [uncultured Caudovirales phage]|uniref:Uncharacterized protein n=1 Tax=uncultured Caudovirales phage TaxID=2100421 RepID=A0A6J5N353_9CAUD|nr:hypothetical protein UFOVP564_15 [uncultured Caudovirales phage]|tara:strand:+ start:44 stop:475 length:432 start_codon:yes stop_codon:yes gene_type:complete